MSVGRVVPVQAYPPVVEDDDGPEPTVPAAAHARRVSNTWAAGTKMQSPVATSDDRAAGLMRRLSIGGAFGRPAGGFAADQGAAGLPSSRNDGAIGPAATRRARRSNTLAAAPVSPKARAPSPMGERILKGHFDGFV